MQYKEFVTKVKENAGLESMEEAGQIVDAVLETLGERLSKTMKEHLAAQLPLELKEPVLKRTYTDRYDLEIFYDRVGARADTGYAHAVTKTRAVMSVLQEAISRGEIEHILSELPEEYEEPFGKEPESPVSPTFVPPRGKQAESD